MKRFRIFAALCLLVPGLAPAQAPSDAAGRWLNRGDDPFLQLSHDLPDCPVPKGPLTDEAEWRAEAHYRAETGTSCWLAGTCTEPNAYRYDAPLAAQLFPRLQAAGPLLQGSSVWVFVQRRIVFLQGCVRDEAQARAFEAAASGAENETMVVPAFRIGADGRVSYRVLPH